MTKTLWLSYPTLGVPEPLPVTYYPMGMYDVDPHAECETCYAALGDVATVRSTESGVDTCYMCLLQQDVVISTIDPYSPDLSEYAPTHASGM